MHKPICLATVLAGLLIGGCATQPTDAAETSTSQPSAQVAPVNKFCAVNPKEAIDPKVTTAYKGKTYGFCCADCVTEFKKDPEKYAANAK